MPQCWNAHWNLSLVEQIRASGCMQHVMTITSTEYNSQISRCRSETEKCQVVILKKKSPLCHAAFDAKVDKEIIQEWTGISRQLGSSSQKKTTAGLTERVSDVLGGLPPPVRHRQEQSAIEKVSKDRLKALCQSGATTCRCPHLFFFFSFDTVT